MFQGLLAKRPERRSRFESTTLPHVDALYGTALRLAHNERDAEDLVQDTLLRAYQAFDDFDGEDRCKPWLFKILTNTFINKYRRRVLERQVADAMERDGDAGIMSASTVRASLDPEEVMRSSFLSDNVRRALLSLPEEFRLAVILCDIEEFSYREIADIMDCPVGTVMSRLHRGRRLLQEALREYAQSEGIVRAQGKDEREGAPVIPLRQRVGQGRGSPAGGGK